jgi:hypothetical protein
LQWVSNESYNLQHRQSLTHHSQIRISSKTVCFLQFQKKARLYYVHPLDESALSTDNGRFTGRLHERCLELLKGMSSQQTQ